MANAGIVFRMARPQGHELSREAWEDILRLVGLNLPRVSDLSEVPQPTLRSLYGGHHKASVPQAHQIANAVGVAPETLFPSMRRPRVKTKAAA